MSDISVRYARRADVFESKVRSVTPDAWDNPSPCPGWTTLDVVRHICDTSAFFLSWVDIKVEGEKSLDEDPVGAWPATRAAVQRALDDPSIAEKVVERGMGTGPFQQFVDDYLAFDLVVHAWDVARAAGVDERLPEVDVHETYERAVETAEIGRQMGAFGAEVKIPEDASKQDKLLALLGRTP